MKMLGNGFVAQHILVGSDKYDTNATLGVYSSFEQAEQAQARANDKGWEFLSIHETTVDLDEF